MSRQFCDSCLHPRVYLALRPRPRETREPRSQDFENCSRTLQSPLLSSDYLYSQTYVSWWAKWSKYDAPSRKFANMEPKGEVLRGLSLTMVSPTAQYRDQICLFTRNLEQCQPDSQHIQSKTLYCYRSPPSPNLEELLPDALVFKNISLDEVADEPTSPSPFQLSVSKGVFKGLSFANFTNFTEAIQVIRALDSKDILGRKLKVEYKRHV